MYRLFCIPVFGLGVGALSAALMAVSILTTAWHSQSRREKIVRIGLSVFSITVMGFIGFGCTAIGMLILFGEMK